MKKLAHGAIGTGSGTLAYTTPAGYSTEICNIDVCNTTSGTIQVSLYLVPVGGSPATTNMLFPACSINGNTLVQWTGMQVLNAGDFIQAIGSGSGLTMNISGNEVRA